MWATINKQRRPHKGVCGDDSPGASSPGRRATQRRYLVKTNHIWLHRKESWHSKMPLRVENGPQQAAKN